MEIPKLGDRVSVWMEGKVVELQHNDCYEGNVRVEVRNKDGLSRFCGTVRCVEPKEVGNGVTT